MVPVERLVFQAPQALLEVLDCPDLRGTPEMPEPTARQELTETMAAMERPERKERPVIRYQSSCLLWPYPYTTVLIYAACMYFELLAFRELLETLAKLVQLERLERLGLQVRTNIGSSVLLSCMCAFRS
jgi:hypothetical protein